MISYLIPFKQVGDFHIESSLSNYRDTFEFKHTPSEDSTNWDTYELVDEGVSLYVDNDIIISISCDQECLYKGRNIIGMLIDEFIAFTGLNPQGEVDSLWVSDDKKQDVYEFDDIGLQVWCEDDIIVTVIATGESNENKK